ncbi:MAG: glycoside hydrolase/phage tail family protein, partial [Pseudomonadota bacterium]
RLPLAEFGNRLPQLSFETFRPVDDFQAKLKGVVLIPGSGEFVYGTTPITRTGADGTQVAENANTTAAATDMLASLDQLEAVLPNVKRASLVVSWFGDDLRAGTCQVRPAVDRTDKPTSPETWRVAGVSRGDAHAVSAVDGIASYGGTPSDAVVVEAIQECQRRGIGITLTPFVLMDIPADNALDNPYAPGSPQPPHPWRGRMTVSVAPGVAGSPDQSAAAAAEIAAFVGTASVSDFSISGQSVTYSGPNEWTLRRQILHYAHLAKAAGGVDAFLLSSELRGLTQVRQSRDAFPFVDALVQLAADVRSVLGPATKITYAADWSEYFGYQPTDGSGDVLFHLDPLWASPAVDAIGIDLYWPLSDWRDSTTHADAATAATPYDRAYLVGNVKGGEGYDWYYASTADRVAQTRTPITDGLGKPWTFRYKDLEGWWSHPHVNRIGGVEVGQPTAWVPQSKPFWFTEFGCAAVDKGANQPNVFIDPKSSESTLPYFSTGASDPLIQRRYIDALLDAFDPSGGQGAPLNPMSSVYAGTMVDLDHAYAYAWDARPYPQFPHDTTTWADGANWYTGHWLNGRASATALDATIAQMARDFGHDAIDVSGIRGLVAGLVVDRVMSLREALQPLALSSFIDFFETGDRILATHRDAPVPDGLATSTLTRADIVEAKPDAALVTRTRAQETELPARAKLTYISASGGYEAEVAEAQYQLGSSQRVSQATLALMLDSTHASEIAESWVREAWLVRERFAFSLPPSRIAVEPGDTVALDDGPGARAIRISEISDTTRREVQARAADPRVYTAPPGRARAVALADKPVLANPDCVFLDVPLLTADASDTAGYIAIAQKPWPGSLAVLQSASGTGYVRTGTAVASAVVGHT